MTQLTVAMRTVTHTATEDTDGVCRCECGVTATTREKLASAHQRSRRVMPAVYETN